MPLMRVAVTRAEGKPKSHKPLTEWEEAVGGWKKMTASERGADLERGSTVQ
jgi:hypothetical protein